MGRTKEEIVDVLLKEYARWYDVKRVNNKGSLIVEGEFHEQGTGYVLVRKAEMWSAESHEYLFIFSADHLDQEKYEACLTEARELGEARIVPGRDHKSSYVTMLIVCNTADEEALKKLRKCRVRKSFRFSLHGWMEVHTAAVRAEDGFIVSNGDGRRTAEFLKSVLYPRKKDLRYRIFKY